MYATENRDALRRYFDGTAVLDREAEETRRKGRTKERWRPRKPLKLWTERRGYPV